MSRNRPVPAGHSRVYRAVGRDEYDDLVKTVRLRQGPNSLGGKWFADTFGGARAFGTGLYPGQEFWIVEADVPDEAPSLFRQPNIDPKGPARDLHVDDLAAVSPRLLGRFP